MADFQAIHGAALKTSRGRCGLGSIRLGLGLGRCSLGSIQSHRAISFVERRERLQVPPLDVLCVLQVRDNAAATAGQRRERGLARVMAAYYEAV